MAQKIVLGITGSIAAYKTIELAKTLIENCFEVQIVLSKSAPDFISVLALKSLFPNKVYEHDVELGCNDEMLHISLAKSADFIIIAPASANMISKLAAGAADCLLSTICLATEAPILVAPAMNKIMWMNKLVQNNILILQNAGFHIVGPESGLQACGDVGMGRMTEPAAIIDHLHQLKIPKIFNGKKIVITAGPTREKIDPVRFISNFSSGKMGYALAKVARDMGAHVTLISGPVALSAPSGLKVILVESADAMLETVMAEVVDSDIFIGTAAVADFKPEAYSTQKIKKDKVTPSIDLTKNVDIIQIVKQTYPHVFCVGFAAETNNIKEYGLKKLTEKKLDLIAINDVSDNTVFGAEHNELNIISKDNQFFNLARDTKANIAKSLLEIIGTQLFKVDSIQHLLQSLSASEIFE